MAKQTIGVGSTPNDGTGDKLRDAYIKINANFDEVYPLLPTTDEKAALPGPDGHAPTVNNKYVTLSYLTDKLLTSDQRAAAVGITGHLPTAENPFVTLSYFQQFGSPAGDDHEIQKKAAGSSSFAGTKIFSSTDGSLLLGAADDATQDRYIDYNGTHSSGKLTLRSKSGRLALSSQSMSLYQGDALSGGNRIQFTAPDPLATSVASIQAWKLTANSTLQIRAAAGTTYVGGLESGDNLELYAGGGVSTGNGGNLILRSGSKGPSGTTGGYVSIADTVREFKIAQYGFRMGTGISDPATLGDNNFLFGNNSSITGFAAAEVNWATLFGESSSLVNNGTGKRLNNAFIAGGYLNAIKLTGGGEAFSPFILGTRNTIENTGGGAITGTMIIGYRSTNSGDGTLVTGYRGHATPTSIGGFVHGFTTTYSSDGNYTGTVEPVTVSGRGSINMSANSEAQAVGHGAYADYSGIFAGVDADIPSTSPRSVVIGGNGIKARANEPDNVYVPYLNVTSMDESADDTQVLVWNGLTKQVKWRNISDMLSSGFWNVSGATEIIDGAFVTASNFNDSEFLTSYYESIGLTHSYINNNAGVSAGMYMDEFGFELSTSFGSSLFLDSTGARLGGNVFMTTAPSLNNSLTDILVRDGSTGRIYYKQASSIAANLPDGDKGDITVSGSGATWTIDGRAVTYGKIQNVTTSRILGRISAGSGSIEELTGTQATSLLNVFTSSAKGLAPASGGSTSHYLRADGVWATPPSGASYSVFTSTTSGLTPASGGGTSKYLRADGTWQTPPNTTYSVFTSAANGLVPASGGGTTNFLRADGTWAAPPVGGGGGLTLAQGTYTPTAIGVPMNMTSYTLHSAMYTRVGDVVTVSGRITFFPTSVGGGLNSNITFTLPIASDIASLDDLQGVTALWGQDTIRHYVQGHAGNNAAAMTCFVDVSGNHLVYYQFMYVVK